MRLFAQRLLLIAASFGLGLLVFHVPERNYSSLLQTWLPQTSSSAYDAILALPVSAKQRTEGGMRFTASYPSQPEFIEINADQVKQQASDCPNLFALKVSQPSSCEYVGKAGSADVYMISRSVSSPNIEAFTERGNMLIAATGLVDEKHALDYFGQFTLVARRDADNRLSDNKKRVEKVVEAIKKDKLATEKLKQSAYSRLPFEPALPIMLPAGWYQKDVKIEGADPKHPSGATVTYRKGSDRFVTMWVKPKDNVMLGEMCGPLPDSEAQYVECRHPAGADYYEASASGAQGTSWYIFRQVADATVILKIENHTADANAIANRDKDTLVLFATSLRTVTRDQYKSARYAGTAFDRYPDIKP